MLGKTDGTSASDGAGYLDIASFLKSYGARPKEDLAELWKRIVFNMAISNTDDHLRNHGFLLTKEGWRLAPLYDINPVPYGDVLSLMVDETSNEISIPAAVSAAPHYGVSRKDAEMMAEKICRTVGGQWEKAAAANGLSREACNYMRPAFDACRG